MYSVLITVLVTKEDIDNDRSDVLCQTDYRLDYRRPESAVIVYDSVTKAIAARDFQVTFDKK